MIIAIVATVVLNSCNTAMVYGEYEDVDRAGWTPDEVLHFDATTRDSVSDCEVLLMVRHTAEYPYQNLWLFVETNGVADTLHSYLADQRGVWFGTKHGGYYEIAVPLRDKVNFYGDTMHIDVRHGMRELELPGITNIGIVINRTNDGKK